MNTDEMESDILQILYLEKDKGLTAGNIAHLLPKQTARRNLVVLLLHKMEQEALVKAVEENKSISIMTPGAVQNTMNITCRNSENGKIFSAEKAQRGPANQWNITHTVYRITEKGVNRTKGL